MTNPRIAILTPVFEEADNLDSYVAEVTETLFARTDVDWQVVFIDDGSRDESWRLIRKVCAGDQRFRGIRLSRNFGSHRAISAGLFHLADETDAVVILAADLQDPPEVVLRFLSAWEDGAKIVWGVRQERDDSPWRILASRVFQWVLKRYAMPPHSGFTTGSFLLMDAAVVGAVREFKESHRITFALVAWTGFDHARVEYDRRPRVAGKSGWTLRQMISTMYDAFLGFSTLPISTMKVAAALSATVAGGLASYLLIAYIVGGVEVPGWTSQMLLFSVFFGIQFWLIGLLGEYLARIYLEVVKRPLYLISERTDPAAE